MPVLESAVFPGAWASSRKHPDVAGDTVGSPASTVMRPLPPNRSPNVLPRAAIVSGRRGAGDVAVEPRGQRGFEEVVDVAVQHALGVARLHGGAQVLHHLVGLQHVGANLVTPTDIEIGRAHV